MRSAAFCTECIDQADHPILGRAMAATVQELAGSARRERVAFLGVRQACKSTAGAPVIWVKKRSQASRLA